MNACDEYGINRVARVGTKDGDILPSLNRSGWTEQLLWLYSERIMLKYGART